MTALNNAITLGTEGANGGLTDANRQSIATQVQSVLQTVVSQANTSYQGVYLFAGTANSQAPFVQDSTSASGYTYQGNSNSNQVKVGDQTRRWRWSSRRQSSSPLARMF